VNFDDAAQLQQELFLGSVIFREDVVVMEKLERSLAQLGENILGARNSMIELGRFAPEDLRLPML
jgi:hypothetical protein